MFLQLGRAEVFVRQAASDNGLDVRVVSSHWLGKLSAYAHGPGRFRVAEVVVEDDSGQRATKVVTLSDNGGVRVA
jgi:hypothetical protein